MASDRRSLKGRVVVVTGAASGIGEATCRVFASEGALVACCDVQPVDNVVAAINSAGGRAVTIRMDVSDISSMRAGVEVVKSELGDVDVLVNNAGVGAMVPLSADDETYEAAWDRLFTINVTAHVRLVRLLLPQLKRRGEGRIINIASTEGLGATLFNSAYVATKHAVVGLTRAMAVELGSQGITVNAVCPGPIRTALTGGIPESAKSNFATRKVPLRRYGDPEEIAHMVVSLALPGMSFVNGSIIPVDGGILSNNAILPRRLPWESRL